MSGKTDGSTTCFLDDLSSQSIPVRSPQPAEGSLDDEVYSDMEILNCSRSDNSWYMQDLVQFKEALMRPLRKAVYLLSGIDEDLTAAVIGAVPRAIALVEAAALAHEELMQNLSCKPLHQSSSVASFLDWHAASQQDIIPRYFALLSQIIYLKDCTDLFLDHIHMSKLAGAQQDGGPLKAVGMAISELDVAVDVLSCSSDSWLVLEQTYRCLAKSADEAKWLRACLLQRSCMARRAMQARYSAFTKSLEIAAQKYCRAQRRGESGGTA